MSASSKKTRFFIIFGVLYTVFLLTVAALYYAWNQRKAYVEHYVIPILEKAIGQDITGKVSLLSLYDGFTIEDVHIGDKARPVLKAKKLVAEFSIIDLTKNILLNKEKNISISNVELENAMLSARQNDDGTYVFFPELQKEKPKSKEKNEDETISWLIKNISIKNSNIEVELRNIQTQVSLSNISLTIQSLGNGSTATSNGNLDMFVRPFGIDTYKADVGLTHGIYTAVKLNSLKAGINAQSMCEEAQGTIDFNNYNFYLSSYRLAGTKISNNFRVDCNKNYKIFYLKTKDSVEDFFLELLDSENSILSYKANIPKFDIRELAFFLPVLKDERIKGDVKGILFEGNMPQGTFGKMLKGIQGSVLIKTSDIFLPKELIEFFPFNVFFFPLVMVSETIGIIPKQIIPNSILSLADDVTSFFRSSQTFKLYQGEMRLGYKDEIFTCEDVKIGTDLTSDINVEGTVNLDKELNIKAQTRIVGIPYRVNIEGTIDKPSVK